MVEVLMREPALHWRCPRCRLEWIDAGAGFSGRRFSTCLRCKTDACEPQDVKPMIRATRVAAFTAVGR
jgi:hypothetical protein